MAKRLLTILAKYPEAGFTKTRLARMIGDSSAARLYEAFLADLAPRFAPGVEHFQFDVCWLYVPTRSDFKELILRLQIAHSLADSFSISALNTQIFKESRVLTSLGEQQDQQMKWAQGMSYERTVIITTDTPHLQRARVENAFQLLEVYDVVVGPVEDGGYYLLGVRHYWPILENVEMSTNHVVRDIIQNTRSANLTDTRLEMMLDIDSWDDLQAFIRLMKPLNGAQCPKTWNTLSELGLVNRV